MVILIGGARSGIGKTKLICKLGNYVKDACAIKCLISDKINNVQIITDNEILNMNGKDTAKYLEAGIYRVVLIKSNRKCLGLIVKDLQALIAKYEYVLIEGNSIARYINPDMVIYIEDKSNANRTKGSFITESMADIKIKAFDYDINNVIEKIEEISNDLDIVNIIKK